MRIQKLAALLPSYSVDGLLITAPKDLFYLLGVNLSRGKLLILKDAAHLIVDGRYFEYCKANIGHASVWLDEEKPLNKLTEGLKSLGFDEEHESYKSFCQLQKEVAPTLLVPICKPLSALRIKKDPHEIELIKAACQLTVDSFKQLSPLLKEGITEKEVASLLEIYWKQHGADGSAFAPIIAFGPNTAYPHHESAAMKLKKNNPVLVDIGALLNQYNSDMTRMIFFGAVDKKIEKILDVVREAHEEALLACSPGISTYELDAIARSVVEEEGFGAHFVHALGHGVGLDIHEPPRLKKDPKIPNVILEEGMVITIEPGIYLPGVGGVRLENTIVIRASGYENLTKLPLDPVRIQ